METITVEVYYGYHFGDTRMWDIDYIDIPGDTPEEKYEEVAREMYLGLDHGEAVIAFVGLYFVDPDQFVDYN